MDFLESTLNLNIDKYSLYYNRLIIHIKLAINRSIKGISKNNILIEHIKEKLIKPFEISQLIGNYLSENYNLSLNENELVFIALHIDRLLVQEIKINK